MVIVTTPINEDNNTITFSSLTTFISINYYRILFFKIPFERFNLDRNKKIKINKCEIRCNITKGGIKIGFDKTLIFDSEIKNILSVKET